MWKRRKLIIGFTVFILCVARYGVWLIRPGHDFTADDYHRINLSMEKAEVEAILGSSGGPSSAAAAQSLFSSFQAKYYAAIPLQWRHWRGRDYATFIGFDDTGKVQVIVGGPLPQENILDYLQRRLFGL